MSTVDFHSLLAIPMDSIQRPKPWPSGTYFGIVTKNSFDKSAAKQTPYVRFEVRVHSAGEDVDRALLEGVDLGKREMRKDYYLTPDALFRLKAFLESVGVTTSGRSLGEAIPDALNARVMLQVTQRTMENGDIINDVGDVRGEVS